MHRQAILRSFHSKKLHEAIVHGYHRILGSFINRGVIRSDSRVHMTSESASHVVSAGRIRPKRSNATAIKYVCIGLLAFNILYGAVLLVLSPSFYKLFVEYAPFFIVYFSTLIITAIAIFDRRDFLLYPILAINVCVLIITLGFIIYDTISMHFCLAHRQAYLKYLDDETSPLPPPFGQYYDCTLINLFKTGWDSIKFAVVTIIGLVLIFIEKSIECYFFRRMQVHFYRIRHPCSVAPAPKTIRVSEIMDDEGHPHDTEDEDDMVIYQKSAKEIHETPTSEPPFDRTAYRSRTIV